MPILFFSTGLNHTLCLCIRTTEHFVQTEKSKALMDALFVDRSVSTFWAAIWDLCLFQTSHLHQKEVSFCEPELSFAEFIYLRGHSTLKSLRVKKSGKKLFWFWFCKRSFIAYRSSKAENYFAKARLKFFLFFCRLQQIIRSFTFFLPFEMVKRKAGT
jgi:hypothetical protein